MKASELRIGNWVHAFRTTWQIDSTDFRSEDLIATYKPIPLTEDWLLKFGLIKVENIGQDWWEHPYKPNYYWFFYKKETITYIGYYSGSGSVAGCGNRETRFVHDFQNLYFALTGEELELK